jgi:hypothetical protein
MPLYHLQTCVPVTYAFGICTAGLQQQQLVATPAMLHNHHSLKAVHEVTTKRLKQHDALQYLLTMPL